MAKIFPFAAKTPESDETVNPILGADQSSVHTSTISEQTPDDYIPIEDLYPVRDVSPVLATAIQLVGEGIGQISESIRMLQDEDLISSDDAVQRFQVMLPELFLCRELGDGFGAIINAIYHGIKNMNSAPLNEKQLSGIRKALKRIHTEPFLVFDEAVVEIMELEALGFNVAPSHLKYAAELLNG